MPPPDFGELIIRTIKRALEPLTTRLATAEAKVEALESLRERLAAAEARLAIADQTGRDQAAALEQAGGRVAALEARQALEALGPTREALAALEARVAALAPVGEALAIVREHVAALEARPPLPGPPGPAGADGLGFDDVGVDYDGQRTLTIRFVAGDRVKTFPIKLPFMLYRGIFGDKTYELGDVVTWNGSMWHCDIVTTTARPGLAASAAAWTLSVKAVNGKDGKDGERGPAGPPGMNWEQTYDAKRAR